MVTGLPSPFDKNELELWNVETSVKTLQIKLYWVFLSLPIKLVQEKGKEIWLQKKKNVLYQHWNIEKQR